MKFHERYHKEDTWYGKVMILEIYHLAMSQRHIDWTISKTADDLGISVGLASENLRLALAMHKNPDLINSKSREAALKWINGVSSKRS